MGLIILPSRGAPLAPASGGGSLVQGQSFTVTGSGFQTSLTSNVTLWDRCDHGGSFASRGWNHIKPIGNAGFGLPSTLDMAYRTTPFTRSVGPSPAAISHPTSRGTKIAAGGVASSGVPNDANIYAISLNCAITIPSFPFVTLARWWEKVDSGYTSPRRNFKWYAWSESDQAYGNNYYYIDMHAQGVTSDLTIAQSELHDDSVPTLWSGGDKYGSAQNLYNWILREVWTLHDSSGHVRVLHGEDLNTTNLSVDTTMQDNYSGTSRSILIAGYNDTPEDCWRYFADLLIDIMPPNGGQFYLCDASTWAASTKKYPQPRTGSFTSTSAPLEAYLGNLTPGSTGYLHYRATPWAGSGHQDNVANYVVGP